MTTATPPVEIPRSSLAHWRKWHSVAVILITAFFVWMAIRRPGDLYVDGYCRFRHRVAWC